VVTLIQFIVNEKGERVGGDYDYVGRPLNINGRIAFRAREGTREFIVNEGGEKTDMEYDEIYVMKSLPDGRAYIIARKNNFYVKEIIRKEFFEQEI